MKHSKTKAYILIVLVLIFIYIGWSAFRPFYSLSPSIDYVLPNPQTAQLSLNWPASGQSAVGIVGTNVLNTYGVQKPEPTASTAKMITSLVVLKAKPLSLGESGPLITLNSNDVAIYSNYLAEQGSVVPVVAGETISEYQMLEAMLLPSANNMADSLAIWAFGSLANYQTAANAFLKANNLNTTQVGADASGFLPTTTSTAANLVKIGEMVMQNNVLAGIVAQKSVAGIPVANTINNVNSLLGQYSVVGIKTGNTNQAGGVFVSSEKININNKPLYIVTANMGSPTLKQSISSSVPLIQTAESSIIMQNISPTGTVFGTYNVPWQNQTVAAINNNPINAYVWRGTNVSLNPISLEKIKKPLPGGSSVGSVYVNGALNQTSNEAPLLLNKSITKPPLVWKLEHPF